MPTPIPPLPQRAWQDGMDLGDLTPQYLKANYLLGVDLGIALGEDAGEALMMQALIGLINDAQSKLGIRFQMQRVLTYPDPALVQGIDYDLLGEPLTAFQAAPGQRHVLLPLPYNNIQRIERVRLFSGTPQTTPPGQASYTIPHEWILFTPKEGILRLTLSGTNSGFDSIYGHGDLRGVWAVDYWMGTGQVDMDIVRWICLGAAIQVLGLAGAAQDLTHGLASESLTQDGQTESVSFYQGRYGAYTGLVSVYQDERDRINLNQKRLRSKGIKVAIW